MPISAPGSLPTQRERKSRASANPPPRANPSPLPTQQRILDEMEATDDPERLAELEGALREVEAAIKAMFKAEVSMSEINKRNIELNVGDIHLIGQRDAKCVGAPCVWFFLLSFAPAFCRVWGLRLRLRRRGAGDRCVTGRRRRLGRRGRRRRRTPSAAARRAS